MKIVPLGNRILIRRADAVTKSAGGIVLPDNAKEKPREGEVLAVGPGIVTDEGYRKEMEVKVGDCVLFSAYSGVEIKHDGEDYVILSQDDVLAVKK